MTLLVTPAPASFPPEPGRVAMWPKAEREIGASGLAQGGGLGITGCGRLSSLPNKTVSPQIYGNVPVPVLRRP